MSKSKVVSIDKEERAEQEQLEAYDVMCDLYKAKSCLENLLDALNSSMRDVDVESSIEAAVDFLKRPLDYIADVVSDVN